MNGNYTEEEINAMETILNLSIMFDITCCADMGICEHDEEFIKRLRNER